MTLVMDQCYYYGGAGQEETTPTFGTASFNRLNGPGRTLRWAR